MGVTVAVSATATAHTRRTRSISDGFLYETKLEIASVECAINGIFVVY